MSESDAPPARSVRLEEKRILERTKEFSNWAAYEPNLFALQTARKLIEELVTEVESRDQQLAVLQAERDEWERLQRQSTVLITQISERAAVAVDHEAMVREDLTEAQTALADLARRGQQLAQQWESQGFDAAQYARELRNLLAADPPA